MANLNLKSATEFKLWCALLFFFTIQSKTLCTVYKVGDLNAWNIPSSSNKQIYETWSKYHNLTVGDSLFFLYPPSQDSVIQVTKQAYDSCSVSNPVLTIDDDGNSLFNITKPGNYYFISGVNGHCEKGQKLHVFAYGEGAYVDSPADSPLSAADAPSYPTVFGSIPALNSTSDTTSLKVPIFVCGAFGFFIMSVIL